MKKIYHANINQRKAGAAILIPDKSRLQSTENYLEVKAQRQRRSLYNDKREGKSVLIKEKWERTL